MARWAVVDRAAVMVILMKLTRRTSLFKRSGYVPPEAGRILIAKTE
jgi:hypothetical protein